MTHNARLTLTRMEATTLRKIKGDLLTALKSGDKFRAGTLRFLLSVIHNAEIAKGKGKMLAEEELAEVLQRQAKQRRESIEAYEKGSRTDLADKEKKELRIIKGYLPKRLSEGEIKKLAQEVIGEVRVGGPQDLGRVMGVLMPKVKGRADGSVVARIVREQLKHG